MLLSLHNLDLFLRQPIQFIHKSIDLAINRVDLALERGLFVVGLGVWKMLVRGSRPCTLRHSPACSRHPIRGRQKTDRETRAAAASRCTARICTTRGSGQNVRSIGNFLWKTHLPPSWRDPGWCIEKTLLQGNEKVQKKRGGSDEGKRQPTGRAASPGSSGRQAQTAPS